MSVTPSLWFLETVQAYEQTNVTILDSPSEVFSAIATELSSLTTGDFAYFCGWEMSPDLVIDGKAWIDRLASATYIGVEVKVLLFAGSPMRNADEERTDWAHFKLRQELTSRKAQCVLDDRLPFLGSNHCKLQIFGKKDPVTGQYRLVAFCGGVDVAKDNESMHDLHARIEGPGAEGVFKNFVFFWNGQDRSGLTNLAWPTDQISTATLVFDESVLSDDYSNTVQAVATYASKSANTSYYSDTEPGKTQIESLHLRAIALAERYIYIEQQYFVHPGIVSALGNALQTQDKLELVIVPNRIPEPETELFQYFCNLYIAQLKSIAADRVHAFGLFDDSGTSTMGGSASVHTKLMIVDDVFVILGSANCNRRSMWMDTEVDIGIVDATTTADESEPDRLVCVFARDLRARLWGQYLRIADEKELYGMTRGLATLKEKAGTFGTLIYEDNFVSAPTPSAWKIRYWNSIVDPE